MWTCFIKCDLIDDHGNLCYCTSDKLRCDWLLLVTLRKLMCSTCLADYTTVGSLLGTPWQTQCISIWQFCTKSSLDERYNEQFLLKLFEPVNLTILTILEDVLVVLLNWITLYGLCFFYFCPAHLHRWDKYIARHTRMFTYRNILPLCCWSSLVHSTFIFLTKEFSTFQLCLFCSGTLCSRVLISDTKNQ